MVPKPTSAAPPGPITPMPLTDFVENWPDAALLIDASGRIRAASADARRLLRLTGMTDGEPGPDWCALFGEDPTARALRSGEADAHVSGTDDAPAGTVLHLRAAPAADGCHVVTVADVGSAHAQKLHREQVERLASIGELLSSVAHELNNPLTTVLGYAEILLAEDASPELKGDLERIRNEATRCRRIVGNLLDLSRSDAPRMRAVQLQELLSKVVEIRAYPAQIAQIELDMDVDALAPPVRADFHRLAQALLNLVTNAEYALSSRSSDRRISLRARVGEQNVEIVVEDNGPGVPPEMCEAIFQPFYTTKPRGKGTGLGLSLVHATAETHGGTIRAEASAEGGARFVITFPTVYA